MISPYTAHPFLTHPPATAQTNIRPKDDPGLRSINPASLPTLCNVTNLDIDVTEACNLGCIYCFKSELYGQSMTLLTMKRALEWLFLASGSAKSINCNFMGGEPTLQWKSIRDFLPWARQRAKTVGKKVTFSMTSNLTLWTDEIRDTVDRYGFGVLMSIDGCPEVQDAQRPAKNGKKMSETVEFWARSLLATRPRSTARATVHPSSIDHLSKSMLYLRELGFKEVTVSASAYADWTGESFAAMRREMSQVVTTIVGSYEKGDPFNLTVIKYLIQALVRHRAAHREQDIKWTTSPCGAGKGYMMVDYTGDIWPCHRFDGADTDAGASGSFRLGNMFESGFHTELQREFLEFDHTKKHKLSCTDCPVNPVCGGYCPAANLSDTKSIYTPHDNYCIWTQAMYAFAEQVYMRCKDRGGSVLERLLIDVEATESDGR